MINLQPGDVNVLRNAFSSGQLTQDDLASLVSEGSFGPDTQNVLAQIMSPSPQRPTQEQFARGDQSGQLPMGSMRNESTGKVTYFQPNAQAPRTQQDPGFSSTPYQAMPQGGQQQAAMRVYGVGGSQVTDLGAEPARALPVDRTRPGIDIPGLGKGFYTADGRSVVGTSADGSQWKAVLGYDAAASDARNARAMAMQKMQADIAQTGQQIEASKESVLASQAQRNMREGLPGMGVPQSVLEKQLGKPDAGMRWKADGTQEPLPGGAVQQQAKTGMESMLEAAKNIDELIGQRDAKGALVPGSKAHPGFEAAVGVSGIQGLFGLSGFVPGTETTDFKRRLDQLKGGAFMQAYQTLKGGGQITEVEGKKATAAITRMDASQSEAEFVKAAQEFKDAVLRGAEKLQARAGAQQAAMLPMGGQAVQPPAQRVVGQYYDTPKGKLMWLGNGWRAP